MIRAISRFPETYEQAKRQERLSSNDLHLTSSKKVTRHVYSY
jgi:hypothetical protein